MPKKKKSFKKQFFAKTSYVVNYYRKSLIAGVIVFSLLVSYLLVSFLVLNQDKFLYFRADVVSSGDIDNYVEIDEVEKVVLAETESPFTDVSFGDENFDAITTLYYKGIVDGYPDGTFKPSNKINRAEFLKFVVEATNVDYTLVDPKSLSDCFVDVTSVSKHWFAPFVCSAKYKGWIDGYADGTFLPSRNIGKAEGLKVILSAFGFIVPEFDNFFEAPYSDISPSDWYLGVAKVGKDNELISSGEKFNASWELTRADVVRMIYRSMQVKGLL